MIMCELLHKKLSKESQLRLLIALNAEIKGGQYDENTVGIKIAQAIRHPSDNSAEERSQTLVTRR